MINRREHRKFIATRLSKLKEDMILCAALLSMGRYWEKAELAKDFANSLGEWIDHIAPQEVKKVDE